MQAKWDEKSEQWIVNDLGKEGSNVNGWHWQEQNKLPWSKQRIDELVKGLTTQLDASIGSAEIKGVKDVIGEVCCRIHTSEGVPVIFPRMLEA